MAHDGPDSRHYDGWDHMERSMVMMISSMIWSKGLIPGTIIRAKLGATPVVVEALL